MNEHSVQLKLHDAAVARMAESWANTVASFLLIVIIVAIGIVLSLEIGGVARLVVRGLRVMVTFGVVLFFLSEPILVLLTRARSISWDPEKETEFRRVSEAVQRLRERNGWWLWRIPFLRPRLYMMNFGVPNAVAFGMGLLGQCGIGVTRELYDLLDDEELEAVLAHEFGHARNRDIGLMTVISMIVGLLNFAGAKAQAMSSPFAILLVLLSQVIKRVIVPIGVSSLQCQREFGADTAGAIFMGDSEELSAALQKLESALEEKRSERSEDESEAVPLDPIQEMVGPLTPTHPEMSRRYKTLQWLVSA